MYINIRDVSRHVTEILVGFSSHVCLLSLPIILFPPAHLTHGSVNVY